MTARRLAVPAPAIKWCHQCGRELVREVTVISEPSGEPRFEPYKKPLLTPFCAYLSAHQRGEEVR